MTYTSLNFNLAGRGMMADINAMLNTFWQDERGQDLIEYTLLLAFVCLASAALFISAGGSVGGIWSSANSDLDVANKLAKDKH